MADYSQVHRGASTRGKHSTGSKDNARRAGTFRYSVLYLLLMGLALLAAVSMVMCAAEAPQQESSHHFNIELPENIQLPESLEIPDFPEIPALPEIPEELREALEGYTMP